MAVAGRFDYLLIESTGLWKACVTCLVTVLVNGVLPNSSTCAETGCAPLLQDMCHKLVWSQHRLKFSVKRHAPWIMCAAIVLMPDMPGC